MVKGNLDATTPTLIRVHLRNTLQDVLGVEHEDFAWPLRRALKRIADEGTGVLVLLRKPENSRDLVQQIVSLNMQGEALHDGRPLLRSEEHTSELQSLMRISYDVFCLKKK